MTELVSAAQDRALPLTVRLRMRVHFLYCSYCRRMRRHVEFLRQAIAELPPNESGDEAEGLGDHAKEELRRLLRKVS